MKISGFILGMLLLSGALIGIINFQSDLYSSYNYTTNNTYLATINQSNSISSMMNETRTKLESKQIENVVDAFDAGLTITFDSIKVSFASIGIFVNMMTGIQGVVQLPDWFVGVLTVAVIILIVFAAIRFWKGGGDI